MKVTELAEAQMISIIESYEEEEHDFLDPQLKDVMIQCFIYGYCNALEDLAKDRIRPIGSTPSQN